MRAADDKSPVHRSTYQQPATSVSRHSCGALCCHILAHDYYDFILEKLGFSQGDDTVLKAPETWLFSFQGSSQLVSCALAASARLYPTATAP
jgi:hypothetical protein